MFVQLSSPLRGMQGRYVGDNFTFFRRNNRQFIRRYTAPSDPKTNSQMTMRQRFVQVKDNWSRNLTEAQRQAWKQWALRYTNPRGIDNIAGFNAFVGVEMNRLALGLVPGSAAPSAGLPGNITQVEQLPSHGANTFRFRLWHCETQLDGARVLVEVTPATLRTTRAPREGDLRRAAGVNAESFLQLRASGEVYELRNALYAVDPGERFGMRVRIISSEIVAGAPVEVDWIRQEFAVASPEVSISVAYSGSPLSSAIQSAAGTVKKPALSPRRARELDSIQREQLQAFWCMLERMHKAPWRPPWLPG